MIITYWKRYYSNEFIITFQGYDEHGSSVLCNECEWIIPGTIGFDND